MQHYSCIGYWTACWTYPRSRLRETFPRRSRKSSFAALFVSGISPPPPVTTINGPPFVLDQVNESFVLYPQSYQTPGFTTDPCVVMPSL